MQANTAQFDSVAAFHSMRMVANGVANPAITLSQEQQERAMSLLSGGGVEVKKTETKQKVSAIIYEFPSGKVLN